MALGCSTNTMLHLPAIAHECGIDIDLNMVNEANAKTPNLCHLAPAGPTFMEDLDRAGGVYAVMKELADAGLIRTDLITCTGKTVGENIANAQKSRPGNHPPHRQPLYGHRRHRRAVRQSGPQRLCGQAVRRSP